MKVPRPITGAAAVAGLAVAATGARLGGRALVARTERRLNALLAPPPYDASERARELHRRSTIIDLHADSLLFGRDLLRRSDRGHIDVPRLVEGGIAIQVFAAPTKVPRRMNIERNDDQSDDVLLLALAQGWPPATWRSLVARAEHLASRLHDMAGRSAWQLTVIASAADLDAFLARRAGDRALVGGLLAIEGAHALEGDIANVERLAVAGYRMVGLAHFFDNAFAGSAHGVAKSGLTGAGRELVAELEARSMIVDVAHASGQTIDDVLSIATRPVVNSHTGVLGTADNARNLSDERLHGIAATGGLIGIGFWPTACGGEDPAAIARAIAYAAGIAGIEHVGLGSDFDGAVPVPFDASGIVQLTEALMIEGFDETAVQQILGGNALRVLRAGLPAS